VNHCYSWFSKSFFIYGEITYYSYRQETKLGINELFWVHFYSQIYTLRKIVALSKQLLESMQFHAPMHSNKVIILLLN